MGGNSGYPTLEGEGVSRDSVALCSRWVRIPELPVP